MKELITFCLMTCGEQTEKECLAAIEPFREHITFQEVRGVYPQVRALNQMLDQVTTPYLVPLDSDMVLDPDAYERVLKAIQKYSHDPSWHSILFHLWDTLTERTILALKVLRTSIVKQYPFVDEPTPDIAHYKCLTDAGYTCIENYLKRPPIGKHIVRGKHFCYHKYKDVYLTLRKNGREWDSGVFLGGRTVLEKSKNHFDYFLYKFLMDDNEDYMHCIAGMVDGLTSESVCSKSLQPEGYRVSSFEAIDGYLGWYQDQLRRFF